MDDLQIRALEPRDADEAHAIASEPEIARTLGGTPFDPETTWREHIANSKPDRSLWLGAFVGGRLAGFAHLEGEPAVRRRHVARVAIAVRASMQRRGVGDALLGALVSAADAWWGYLRLELGVLADHAAAIALYSKHGFVVETRRRDEMLVDGAFRDCLGMARMRPGWTSLPELGAPPPIGPRRARAEVTIRGRRASDATSFARQHETASVMEGTFQMPFQTTHAWEQRFASTMPGAHVLVAEIDGVMVGSAGLFPLGQTSRFRHVLSFGISVHPDAQGAGVGDALMRATTELADRWLATHRIVLEVFTDNARARALYERHGFVVEGVERAMALRRGAHVDAHVMSRLRR
jgi:putative acetyltransferase